MSYARSLLYKVRWGIEKIFDPIKNKLLEQKAWAQSQNAKIQQAHFITLAHNLMVLLNHQIETQEGIMDQKSQGKRTQRRAEEVKQAQGNGEQVNSLVRAWKRVTQRCFQFIR